MGVISLGHRLTILKNVYDVKVRQEVPIDPDNYLPPCKSRLRGRNTDVLIFPLAAEASLNDQTASLDDISRLIRSIKIRDERLLQLETELRRSNDEYQRLNTELKPVFQMMKDRSKPLPYHPPGASPNDTEHHDNMTSPAFSHTQSDKGGSSLSRKFSTKRLFLNSASKGSSPTHIPSSILESRSAVESSNLDPSAAAVAASSHLMASTNGAPPTSSSPNTITLPSPTSPNTYANQPQLNARTYQYREGPGQQTPNTARPYYPSNDDTRDPYMSGSTMVESDREPRTATPNLNSMRQRRADRDDGQAPAPSNASVRSEAPSVEIFKSFRVSMEDPCYKVLPAALKKYQINADWRQYALYIVYGDQERCLGREEKPLILFKQLDREGKKPMFMLRRHAAPIEGHSGPSSGTAGAVGYDPAPTNARAATGIQFPPGGVL